MIKYFIGVIIFVVVAVAAYYAWQALGTSIVPTPPPPPPAPIANTYATSTFSVSYPGSYLLDENYAYEGFPNKPVAGVKFSVPLSATEGTNLGSDSGVSIESLPRAQNCTGDIYVVPNVKAVALTVGSTTYSTATSSSGAAGNLYEEQVFAISGSKPCTAVRYTIHSSNLGNFEEGSVAEFDRGVLLREFDSIRDSLELKAPSAL
jgi:hypothetical protein